MSWLKFSTASLGVFLAILFVPVSINAQVAGATLAGTVTDPNGAAIPNVQVTIKNVATGVSRTVTTDEAGFYTVPNLNPAVYEVTASASGFKTTLRRDVALTVGAQQPLDLQLEVGEVSHRVEVTMAQPAVESTTSAIRAAREGRTVP